MVKIPKRALRQELGLERSTECRRENAREEPFSRARKRKRTINSLLLMWNHTLRERLKPNAKTVKYCVPREGGTHMWPSSAVYTDKRTGGNVVHELTQTHSTAETTDCHCQEFDRHGASGPKGEHGDISQERGIHNTATDE